MMTLAKAQQALELVRAKAEEMGVAVSASVVDPAGTLVASIKMDKAISISPKFSFTKAFTSATIGMPTSAIAAYDVPGMPYYGLHTIMAGSLTTIAGGQPIVVNGTLIGGIGVGGSTDVSQDDTCATAGLVAFA